MSEKEVFDRIAQKISDDFAKDPRKPTQRLTDDERAQLKRNKKWTEALFGKAMERAFAAETEKMLKHLSKPGVSTPDFASFITGHKYDLTVNTASSIKKHQSKPYFKDGSTEFIFYNRPTNVSFATTP